jgi:hypothetical protein
MDSARRDGISMKEDRSSLQRKTAAVVLIMLSAFLWVMYFSDPRWKSTIAQTAVWIKDFFRFFLQGAS